MSEKPRKNRAPQAPKRVKYFTGKLGCQRCTAGWSVVDLNPERKVVQCPVCAEPNDIREAINRGRGTVEHVATDSGSGK